jgi:hypothetical protein
MSTKQSRKQRKAENAIRSIVRQEIKKERDQSQRFHIPRSMLLDFSWLTDASSYCHAERLLPFPHKSE